MKNGKLGIELRSFQLGQLFEEDESKNLEFKYYFDSMRFKGDMKIDQRLYIFDYDFRSRNKFKHVEIFIMIQET